MHKLIALTFDDGPSEYTHRLLDALNAAGAVATFFLIGQNVSAYPEAVRRMVAEGHQIGNHSWDHPDIRTLIDTQLAEQLERTSAMIAGTAGVWPEVFRPPYGLHDPHQDALIGYPLVLWDVDTRDWEHHDADQAFRTATDQTRAGSVILMHDIHESSIDLVPRLVAALKSADYTPVTGNELFTGQLQNSVAYHAAGTDGSGGLFGIEP